MSRKDSRDCDVLQIALSHPISHIKEALNRYLHSEKQSIKRTKSGFSGEIAGNSKRIYYLQVKANLIEDSSICNGMLTAALKLIVKRTTRKGFECLMTDLGLAKSMRAPFFSQVKSTRGIPSAWHTTSTVVVPSPLLATFLHWAPF